MHDLRAIRDNPVEFDAGLKTRGLSRQAGEMLALDERRRALQTELQGLLSQRNAHSKEIGAAMKAGDKAQAETLKQRVEAAKSRIASLEAEEALLAAQLDSLLMSLPNLPAADVPLGADEAANVELRRVGSPREFGFAVKEHDALGGARMDFDTAAKLSGARFVVLKGELARLERALAAFMLDLHTREFGYTEVSPPLMVRDAALVGTGQLPKFKEDLFNTLRPVDLDVWRQRIDSITNPADVPRVLNEISEHLKNQDHFYLIPTSEVPLTNLVREKILADDELPLRFTAFTPCFRSEAGAAGRDTRGMIRQHQFSKVELVSITRPEDGPAEHERMTACAETVLQRLGLAYRVMLLSTGDMGFSARKTYDLEVWLPGQKAYREISSCSWCGDFQARRMGARLRVKDGKGTRFVHTLNGSGLAVGRTLIAVLENYQNEDGSITVPDALTSYMGGLRRIEPAK